MPWVNRNAPNYSTDPSSQVEDTFISEMMSEYGRFNQDFFIMKILSKAIDTLGTDPQRFILLVDILELALINSQRITEDYKTRIEKDLKNFETTEGKRPNDLENKLTWELKRAGVKFSVLFGYLANTQPIEIVGEVNPGAYIELKKKRQAEKDKENL